MKVDLTKKFKNIDGTDLMWDNTKSKVTTLKVLLPQILLGEFADEKIEAEEKLKRFKLAMEINKIEKAQIELDAEDVVYIKKICGKACTTLMYGQLVEMLPK